MRPLRAIVEDQRREWGRGCEEFDQEVHTVHCPNAGLTTEHHGNCIGGLAMNFPCCRMVGRNLLIGASIKP